MHTINAKARRSGGVAAVFRLRLPVSSIARSRARSDDERVIDDRTMDALLLILDTVRTSPRAPAMATMAARRCCLRRTSCEVEGGDGGGEDEKRQHHNVDSDAVVVVELVGRRVDYCED